MIYLEETFNIIPASPEGLDLFVEFVQEKLIPACERLGLRLVVAWYSNVDMFSQVTHVMEFDDMDALKAFRRKASQDQGWGEFTARLEELAPERQSRLLEPSPTVPPKILHKAIRRSQKKAIGSYSLAVLNVAPDKMQAFLVRLAEAAAALPIIASWRPVAGNPNEVIDLWRGALPLHPYRPAGEALNQIFQMVRELAPQERLRIVSTLPYSQLR